MHYIVTPFQSFAMVCFACDDTSTVPFDILMSTKGNNTVAKKVTILYIIVVYIFNNSFVFIISEFTRIFLIWHS